MRHRWRPMRSMHRSAWAAALVALLGCRHFGGSPGTDATPSLQQAIDRVAPALVRIFVVEADYSGGRSLKSEASGSGVVMTPDGYVVTNHHVAGHAIRIDCTMPDGERIPARLVGTDPLADVAVIRLEPREPRRFAYAVWGDSDRVRTGDPVLAMGSPLALSQSVTQGIVSNTRLTIPGRSQLELDGENVGSIVRWIGHDATILPGNSGGPLVNLRGEVIGINEIRVGLGGAIPSNLARDAVQQLIARGRVNRAWLGLVLQPLFRGDPRREGAIVSDVIAGSPAAEAGLRAGDRLLAIGGDAITVQFPEELPLVNQRVAALPLGRPTTLRWERDGALFERAVTPVLRERVQPNQREFADWGLTGRNLSLWTRLQLRRPTTDGVLVTSVRPGGPAGQARPAIEPGDVLVRIADRPIRDVNELSSATARLTERSEGPTPVLVEFERRNARLLTVVELGRRPLTDPGADVRRAWLPIETQVLTRDLARMLGVEGRGGVRVTRRYEAGSEADEDRLRVGDLIVAIDGSPIPAREAHDTEVFDAMIRQYAIDSTVTLTVVRNGRERAIVERLRPSPPPPREMKRFEDQDFDFVARNVSDVDRRARGWEDEPDGVLVESVAEGGWAALAGMAVGDLLLEFDGQPVRDVEQLRERIDRVRDARRSAIVVKVRRGIQTLFLEIEPLWDDAR